MSQRLCPKCSLPTLRDDDAENSLSHDGKTIICSMCGQIESLYGCGAIGRAQGLELSQRQAQAALYGLDKNGQPKLPKLRDKT